MSEFKNRLSKIVSKDTSKWVEKAEWRIANEGWLDKSAKIALKILRAIRLQNLTQKDLADKLSVSPQHINKILKGEENLTLETIDKIERVLNIILVDVPEFQTINKFIPVPHQIFFSYKKKQEISSESLQYNKLKPYTSEEVNYHPLKLVS